MEAIRSSLGRVLHEWQSAGVLHDSPTYRGLPGGDRRFQLLGRDPRWCPLSPQDRATIVLALHLGECAVLTCERLLAAAARHHGVTAINLFDVIRVALHAARLTPARAEEMCAEWDRDRFSAGRPIDYSGSFERSAPSGMSRTRSRSDLAACPSRLVLGLHDTWGNRHVTSLHFGTGRFYREKDDVRGRASHRPNCSTERVGSSPPGDTPPAAGPVTARYDAASPFEQGSVTRVAVEGR